jgi:hypothetical protein
VYTKPKEIPVFKPNEIPKPKVLSSGRKIVTDEQRVFMKSLYEKQGLSSWKIAAILGYKNVCVINNLKKAGVVMRNRSDANKTISVNRDYFKEIDTPIKAYLLGLFYADGNVSKDSFTIALQEPDKYLLEEIAKEIEYDSELQFRPKENNRCQNMFVLRVHDKLFCTNLRKWGVVPRKTSILSFPYFLNESLYPSFLHGLLDGDGCVYIGTRERYLCVNMAGSPTIIKQIAIVLKQKLGIHTSPRSAKHSRGWFLTCSNMVAVKMLDYIYSDANPICLERKKSKFITALRYYRDRNFCSRKRSKVIIDEVAPKYLTN